MSVLVLEVLVVHCRVSVVFCMELVEALEHCNSLLVLWEDIVGPWVVACGYVGVLVVVAWQLAWALVDGQTLEDHMLEALVDYRTEVGSWVGCTLAS